MLRIATLADVHFNAVKPDKLYEQLNSIFLGYLKTHELDMVVIAGDFYHSIVSFNSYSAKLSMEFMSNLLAVATYRGIRYIRIIKGTSSHDNNQLENFRIFEKREDINLRIFDTVAEEEIDGYRILYLPEEYMKNVDEFYSDYFSQTYDVIFGHGMFRETAFAASKQESAITLSKAPVFDSKKMCEICKGPIIFGHIHTRCSIRDKITYVGSFSRWVYGEESPKGFLVTLIKDDGTFANEFIENTLAERYDTVVITDIHEYNDNPEKFVNEMKVLLKDHLRITVILSGEHDYAYITSFLREYYSKKPEYKLQIVDKTEVIKQVEQEKKLDDLMEKYKFVFDSNISRPEKISKFIKVRDKSDVSVDRIETILKLK